MDEKDIYKLFISALEDPRNDNDSVRGVFSALVSTTLRYRDEMLERKGTVVTVEDVRICLGWLIPALVTDNMPLTDNTVRLGLLKLWLNALGKRTM